MSKIVGIDVRVEGIGKRIKMSKQKITWELSIDGQGHTIELLASFTSGKRRIFHNKQLIHDKRELLDNIDFAMQIGNNMINIHQKKEVFEMRVNNVPFALLNSSRHSRRKDQKENAAIELENENLGIRGNKNPYAQSVNNNNAFRTFTMRNNPAVKKKADFGDFNDFQGSSNNNEFSSEFGGSTDFNFSNFDNPTNDSSSQQQSTSAWGDFSKPVAVTVNAQSNLPQNKFTDLLSSDDDEESYVPQQQPKQQQPVVQAQAPQKPVTKNITNLLDSDDDEPVQQPPVQQQQQQQQNQPQQTTSLMNMYNQSAQMQQQQNGQFQQQQGMYGAQNYYQQNQQGAMNGFQQTYGYQQQGYGYQQQPQNMYQQQQPQTGYGYQNQGYNQQTTQQYQGYQNGGQNNFAYQQQQQQQAQQQRPLGNAQGFGQPQPQQQAASNPFDLL